MNTLPRAVSAGTPYVAWMRKVRCKSVATAITVKVGMLIVPCRKTLPGKGDAWRFYRSSGGILLRFAPPRPRPLGELFTFILFVKILRKEDNEMKSLTKITLLLLALLTLFCFVSCADVDKTGAWETATYDRNAELGEGAKTVTVKVIAEEQELTFIIHTDKETLGDALLEHKLIDGEDGPYGLYVKAVNGIVADYNVDQTYWGLTKNGELSMTGVDATAIADGEQYELTKTK